MANQVYVLNYSHEQVNALLEKIDKGFVLDEAQFKKLIEEIGLENISTFSGDFADLVNVPAEKEKLSQFENDLRFISAEALPDASILVTDEKLAAELANFAKVEDLNLLFVPIDPDKGLSTNDLTNELKAQYDAAVAHAGELHLGMADVEAKIDAKRIQKVSELGNDLGFVTLVELDAKDFATNTALRAGLDTKVDIVPGCNLLADADKADYDDAVIHSNRNDIHFAMADVKVEIQNAIMNKADKANIPTLISQLANDAGFQKAAEVNNKITAAIAPLALKSDVPEGIKDLADATGMIDNKIAAAVVNFQDEMEVKNAIDNAIVVKTLQTKAQVDQAITDAVASLVKASDFAALQSNVTDAVRDVAAIDADVDSFKAMVYNKGEVDSLLLAVNNAATALEGRVNILEGFDIDTRINDLEALNLEEQLNQLKADYADLLARVEALE